VLKRTEQQIKKFLDQENINAVRIFSSISWPFSYGYFAITPATRLD
jgi:hypothetical protein